MAGLVPAIHAFASRKQDVDARHKAGHDEFLHDRRCVALFAIAAAAVRFSTPSFE